MSVEERLDLIGKKLIENDNLSSEEGVVTGGSDTTEDTEWKAVNTEFTNNTNYTLIISSYETASALCTDYNSHDYDFHWTLGSNIKILDADGTSVSKNMIVGFAGSNNTQYDHRTYDTITSERNIELIPGATITVSSVVTFHHISAEQEIGSHDYDIKFIRNLLTVVGVKENQ